MEKLLKLKNTIEKYKQEILTALKEDLGKNEKDALMTEYVPVIEEINLFIKKSKSWSQPKRVWGKFSFLGCRSYSVREAYGEVLIISPWNYPFQLAMLPVIAALGAGNKVILKPSEFSLKTTEIILKISKELNLDEFKVVTGDSKTSEELLKQKFDYIFFTGSTEVGRIVYQAAAKNLTPVTLELGGKSPVVIEPDCDFKSAVEKILWGKLLNSGQTCIAPDYVYLPKGKSLEFIEIVDKYLMEFGGVSGKIINEKHYNRILNLLENQKIIYKEKLLKDENISFRIPLNIVLNPDLNSPIMKEEIFGPILPILEYDSDKLKEVYQWIKNRPKPLALYIFRKNKKNLETYGVSSGGVCINGTILQVAESALPFGGVGESGLGNYHGKHSFKTFTHEKAILETSFLKVKFLEMKKKFL
ncbi:MAG: aldehyde dehydrogenase family protein [Fusobacteriaceae bacterium]